MRVLILSCAKPPAYTAAPVPAPGLARYQTMLAVLGGALTVSEGARSLGLSRPRFQTLLHRGLTGFVTALEMKRPRRPPRPTREVTLAEENARLRRENTRLRAQVAQTGRLLQLASASLTARSQVGAGRRRAPAKGRWPAPEPPSEVEPDVRHDQLTAVGELRARGLPLVLAAAVVGASVRTVKRWAHRARRGELPGVLRGVDGMHLVTPGGRVHVLVAADGCIPYRTSLQPAAQSSRPT